MTADHAKAIADYFAEMFDRECANTLKVLRAVPNDRRDYTPSGDAEDRKPGERKLSSVLRNRGRP